MTILILGLILFIGAHLTPTLPNLRAALAERLGQKAYELAFTGVSLAGLLLIILGAYVFRGSGSDVLLWTPPVWSRHLAFALMLVAFVLLAAAYIPSHIRDRVLHPMLTAVVLWSAAHLAANGNLLALLLFGSFLVFAVVDRISLARRGVGLKKPAQGFGGDAMAIVAGVALWLVTLLWLHKLAGVPLLAG